MLEGWVGDIVDACEDGVGTVLELVGIEWTECWGWGGDVRDGGNFVVFMNGVGMVLELVCYGVATVLEFMGMGWGCRLGLRRGQFLELVWMFGKALKVSLGWRYSVK